MPRPAPGAGRRDVAGVARSLVPANVTAQEQKRAGAPREPGLMRFRPPARQQAASRWRGGAGGDARQGAPRSRTRGLRRHGTRRACRGHGEGRVDQVVPPRDQGNNGVARARVVPEHAANSVIGGRPFDRPNVLKVVRERDERLAGCARKKNLGVVWQRRPPRRAGRGRGRAAKPLGDRACRAAELPPEGNKQGRIEQLPSRTAPSNRRSRMDRGGGSGSGSGPPRAALRI